MNERNVEMMDDTRRENVVREALWSTFKSGGRDYRIFEDLARKAGFAEPSADHAKAFFMVMELDDFCECLKYGCTAVDLSAMVEDDRVETLEAMQIWASSARIDLGAPRREPDSDEDDEDW